MSLIDVYRYHTPIVIVNLTNGGFISANPGGWATPLSPMENPAEVTDEKGTNYARSIIPGNSHPRYHFISGEPRILRMKMLFHWSADPTSVKRNVNWLQSLQYPTAANSVLLRPPPICMIVFGLLYRGIKVLFTSVRVRYYDLFEPFTLYPLRAEVELVAEEWVESSVNASSVVSLF